MSVELKIPSVGESITEALIAQWFKSEGDTVEKDEPVAELETDKVTVELPAPVAGVLVSISRQEGETVAVGDIIGVIAESDGSSASTGPSANAASPKSEGESDAEPGQPSPSEPRQTGARAAAHVLPSARRALAEYGLEADQVRPTGPSGRLLREDVERHAAALSEPDAEHDTAEDAQDSDADQPKDKKAKGKKDKDRDKKDRKKDRRAEEEAEHAVRRLRESAGERAEEIVPMSPIRKRIAERLVEAQRVAALLTTFNEVDMSAVVALRQKHRDAFENRHGVKLGFMSFFVKAAIDALRQFPQINAEVRGTDIVYRNYYDIGMAVSTDRGLLVPVLRNAETMSFAEIETTIGDFVERARSGKIRLDDLEGGTFTITNGGVFGSMLSTPIVNPPQSGVLGLHAIEDRPIASDGQVVIHPMMYVALSYDHRIVDGREAVTFLRRIKETIEDPTRILLES
ncbi:MAG TPA: 2-oxoglutarate dehydrogenase complex dihydrolipoyllysine-residue succinyltransferase [Thermoanaerobaculia bacterium]|nr:2-oxoglutarate dehydrogenase complex dihydrolipoyllysine-residue succinyltransferase [Thermoanaerobaculia bacterium]